MQDLEEFIILSDKVAYKWHQPIEAQHAALKRRIQGHITYFGASGNFARLMLVAEEAKRR